MTKVELETIINFNAEEKEAEIYSCQTTVWRRCEKLGLKPIKIIKNDNGDIVSKSYSCNKNWIKINKPRKLNLTDEQKEKIKNRLAGYRQNKK